MVCASNWKPHWTLHVCFVISFHSHNYKSSSCLFISLRHQPSYVIKQCWIIYDVFSFALSLFFLNLDSTPTGDILFSKAQVSLVSKWNCVSLVLLVGWDFINLTDWCWHKNVFLWSSYWLYCAVLVTLSFHPVFPILYFLSLCFSFHSVGVHIHVFGCPPSSSYCTFSPFANLSAVMLHGSTCSLLLLVTKGLP